MASCNSNIDFGKNDNTIFQSFADRHTLALWLFDESEYNYTTLCDASNNYYDLRLLPAGHLLPGKYGNALNITEDSGQKIAYAGFAGKVVNNHIRRPEGEISGLWGPTEGPKKLLNALRTGIWTFEFWLKFDQKGDSITLFDMGQGYDPGLTLTYNENIFTLISSYSGIIAKLIQTTNVFIDNNWHHLALCQNGNEITFFIDGSKQPHVQTIQVNKQQLPDFQKPLNREHEHRNFGSMSMEERKKNRFNVSIGNSRSGKNLMTGSVDEMRFSDLVRYADDFELPASFARKFGAYGAAFSKPAVANGPVPLFPKNNSGETIQFGLRKHVFIDSEILDILSGVFIKMNSPFAKQKTDFIPKKSAWRPTIVDIKDKVYLYIPEGYDSEKGRTFLYVSSDGIHFTEHKDSPVINNLPLYGTFFEDKNPDILAEEKYKLTAWVANLGIQLFFSPDGLHWRRNETLILPLVSGGRAESYYDDPQGRYILFIRRDTSFRTDLCPGGARQCIMFETDEPVKTWPFKHLEQPYYEGWILPAVTCEGPAIFDETESGQAYRSRAIKYPWAADVYLAFVWRYPSDQGDDPARHIDLGISRDGKKWQFFEPDQGWYIPLETDPDPEQISIYGLIRRGNEIWQYTDHGGPHGGSPKRTYYRWKQRLDGFTSLDGTGYAITKPIIFKESNVKLILNSSANIKVALLDAKGNEYPEYTISKCDQVIDSVTNIVSWHGRSDLSRFSEIPIRLKFELSDSKIYAFELRKF